MAGPVASIITGNIISEDQIQEIKKYINENASLIKTEGFWIRERPFIINFGLEFKEELQEHIENGISDIIGWEPKDKIIISAMANQEIDHKILAELCTNISQKLNGLIDFTGELNIGDERIQGTLFKVPYKNINGEISYNHIGDIEFLIHWMKNNNFRMIK
ncbi:MAG: hypothetical protein GY756_13520 [bacterium]|nr:hypothetical protein [bacterium]